MHVCVYIFICIHAHVYEILVNTDCVYIALLPGCGGIATQARVFITEADTQGAMYSKINVA